MSFFGVHRGFIQPHRTAHSWLTSCPMATPWAQMMMTTLSVGMTSEPGPKFCFPRSILNSVLATPALVLNVFHHMVIKMNFFWNFPQGFLEKSTEELQLYKAHSDNYICSLMPGTSSFQAQYTPGQQSPSLSLPYFIELPMV